jgi:hypothetical protein
MSQNESESNNLVNDDEIDNETNSNLILKDEDNEGKRMRDEETEAIIDNSYMSNNTEQPYIVYSLKDYEILEDWSIIKMHNDLRTVTTEC